MHMATVIERPRDRVVEDRTVYTNADSSAGWAVALIVLVVLALIALFAWPGFARRAAPVSPSTLQVNVPSGSPAAPSSGSQSSGAAPAAGAPSGASGSVSGSAAGSATTP
jgi:hypothetical protein